MDNHGDFTFRGQGTLKRIDTFVSKAGKSILTLVFETQGQYPQLVPIKVFGRLAEQASAWKPGSVLAVTGRLGGRDWNGKVYGDNVATSIEVVGGAEERSDGLPRRRSVLGAVPEEGRGKERNSAAILGENAPPSC
jgi:single-stranded DNA-binding protein